MKYGSRIEFVKGYIFVYLFFIFCGLFRNDPDKLSTFMYLTGFFGLIIIVSLILTLFVKSEVYNTVIEITEDQLVRTGDNLLTVKMKFTEIDKIITKKNGTILLKTGIIPTIQLYSTRGAYLNEPDILFIPLAIENYHDIIKHINQKKGIQNQ